MENDTTYVALTRSRCRHRALSRADRLASLFRGIGRRSLPARGERRGIPTTFYWTISVVGALGGAVEEAQLEP
jgi:hypothetical protein